MESLALRHPHIDHTPDTGEKGFYIYEREDVIAGIVNSLAPGDLKTLLFILPFGIQYDQRGNDVVYSKDPSYMVLVFVDDVNDMTNVTSAMDKSEEICHQINKKIKQDIEEELIDLGYIDYNSIDMNPILRFHGNFYGFQVFLPIADEDNTCVDDDLWTEINDEE